MRIVTFPISVYIPSRNRIELLIQSINSILTKANNLYNFELIILLDDDDIQSISCILNHFLANRCNYNLIIRPRQPQYHRDLINYGAQVARGRYIWCINDECEILTPNWDVHLYNKAEEFLKDKPDKILYYGMQDDTHTRIKCHETNGCCFPILSVETIDTMNISTPIQLQKSGGDTQLYRLFTKLRDNYGINRILWDFDLAVTHKSAGNGYRDIDETQNTYQNGDSELTSLQINSYLDRLLERYKDVQ